MLELRAKEEEDPTTKRLRAGGPPCQARWGLPGAAEREPYTPGLSRERSAVMGMFYKPWLSKMIPRGHTWPPALGMWLLQHELQ